jgi:hypothetical protein
MCAAPDSVSGDFCPPTCHAPGGKSVEAASSVCASKPANRYLLRLASIEPGTDIGRLPTGYYDYSNSNELLTKVSVVDLLLQRSNSVH